MRLSGAWFVSFVIVFKRGSMRRNGVPTMPLQQSDSRSAFESNLKAELGAGKPRAQSLAIAYSVQRRNHHALGGGIGGGFAHGGVIPDIPFHEGGLIRSGVAGRTDRIPMVVGSDSHVIPADAVSGAGQGSSEAGANIWKAALKHGPWGSDIPKMVHGPGPPHAPHAASGGATRDTQVLVAGQELVVPPDIVADVGRRGIAQGRGKKGETPFEAGHRLIDEAIKHIREYTIDWLRRAPAPKK